MAITYMRRQASGIYQFRQALPEALKGKPAPAYVRVAVPDLINTATGRFKHEVKSSLKTHDEREAKRRDKREAVRVDGLITLAGRLFASGEDGREVAKVGTGPDLEELQAATLRDLLAADEAERRDGDDRRQLFTADERRSHYPDLAPIKAAEAKGMDEDHHLVLGDYLEELAGEYRQALAKRDPGIVRADLAAALQQRGIPADPLAPWFYDAGLAVLRGHVDAYGRLLKRQAGDDVPTPPKVDASTKGPKISQAFEAWKAGSPARGSRKPGPNTVREATYAVRRFMEWHGDKRLAGISRENVRDFRDALAKVPTRLPAKLRPLPIREVLKHPAAASLPMPHTGTVNKALTLLSAILAFAEREGRLDAAQGFVNPFGKGMKLAADERAAEEREPFTTADLAAIFTTPVFARGQRPEGGGGEAAFWLPLIALFTGARQSEIAQLRVGDLTRDPESGLWFFDIGTKGGRTIKTASSRRRVPVHPELYRIGLLRYRDQLAGAGGSDEEPLWPGVKSDSAGRRAGPWSKWFNRYLRDAAKVSEAAKVFHSYRHTFKRMARDAGLSEEMHDALTGHTGEGGSGRSYGRGFSLKALAAALGRLEVPEAVKGLEWQPAGASRQTTP